MGTIGLRKIARLVPHVRGSRRSTICLLLTAAVLESTPQDLYWMPTTPNSKPFGALGFYRIGIPMGACQDKGIVFDVRAGDSKAKMSAANVHSPPYGTAVSANLILADP